MIDLIIFAVKSAFILAFIAAGALFQAYVLEGDFTGDRVEFIGEATSMNAGGG